MDAKIIDGKAIAEALREEVQKSVRERISKGLPAPGLATVIIGDNPASKVYVRMKQKACQEAGILSVGHELPRDADQEEVEALVRKLNAASWCSFPCPLDWMRKASSIPLIFTKM